MKINNNFLTNIYTSEGVTDIVYIRYKRTNMKLIVKVFLLCMMLTCWSHVVFSQFDGGPRTVLTKAELDKQYQENIKKARIDGIYIPVDEEDAMNEIKALSPPKGLDSYRSLDDEYEAAKKIHFGLGRWINVNWSFTTGSRMSHYLKEKGLVHPDDMVTYLLVVLHRTLNEKSDKYDDVIEKLSKERKEIARSQIDKVISEERKKK